MKNKNVYQLIGKTIKTKADNSGSYGYLYLAYPLENGEGLGFTDYSKVYIPQAALESMSDFNIGDKIAVTYGYSKKDDGARYIKTAIVVKDEAEYVPVTSI